MSECSSPRGLQVCQQALAWGQAGGGRGVDENEDLNAALCFLSKSLALTNPGLIKALPEIQAALKSAAVITQFCLCKDTVAVDLICTN